MLANGLQI